MFRWIKCPTSFRIPHLAGQRLKSYKAERKTVILYFAESQMPFVLIVHIVTVFLCVLGTLMMGSSKIHSSHEQRGGWVVLQHKAELLGKPGGTGRGKTNRDSSAREREVKILVNSLKPWPCSVTFWALLVSVKSSFSCSRVRTACVLPRLSLCSGCCCRIPHCGCPQAVSVRGALAPGFQILFYRSD